MARSHGPSLQYIPPSTTYLKYSTTQRQSMIQKGKRAKVWCGVELMVENRKSLCTQPTQPRKAGARNMTHYNRLIYKYDQQQDRMDIGLIPSTRTLYIGYTITIICKGRAQSQITEKGHQ